MTSHMQVGVGGTGGTNTSISSLNRLLNQNYEKLRTNSTATTTPPASNNGGSSGMDRSVNGQLANTSSSSSSSSSSLDYLYQAISLIEQKTNSMNGANLNGNGSSKMATTHPNSCVSLNNHLNNNNNINSNSHIQQQQHQQFYQQQQQLLNLNEAKGSRLVRGKTLLKSNY
jgi:hypothetical protein